MGFDGTLDNYEKMSRGFNEICRGDIIEFNLLTWDMCIYNCQYH